MRFLALLIALCGLCIMPLRAQNTDEAYQEALRRIEEARVSGATGLYLLGLTNLPPELGQLINLEVLDLSGNQFTTLPPEIGQLSNLQTLYLSDNRLTSLPSDIGRLRNLQRLYLSDNQLSSLPAEFGQLSNLRELHLERNSLISLPPEFGQLKNLAWLSLHNNQLMSLPAEFGQLKNLEWLNLTDNQLTALPLEIGQITSLQRLYTDPLVFPPPEVTEQGPASTLFYLREREASKMIVGLASGVGALVGVILAFRWRQRRGLQEKKKR